MNYDTTFIVIHLKKFKSADDFKKLFEDHKIEIICPNAVFDMISQGYTKIFLDKTTHRLVAFCHSKYGSEVKLCDDFTTHLKNLKSISFNKETPELTVDLILDKINLKGIDSLNRDEKEFLEKNSK